jgi:hypothetical protein
MGAFETFVNANLGIRKPLITDVGPPSGSSKAAGIVGSQYLDSSSNFLYEKTGDNNNLDWKFIRVLGSSNDELANISGNFTQELSEINQDLLRVSGVLEQEISSLADNFIASKVNLPTGIGDIFLRYQDIHHSLNFNNTPHVYTQLTSNSGCPVFHAYSTYEVDQNGFKVAFSDNIKKPHQALELLIVERTFNSNALLSQEIDFEDIETGYLSSGTYDLDASATSRLDVSFSGDNDNIAEVSGSVLHLNSQGFIDITASQSGNQFYAPAQNVTRSLHVVDDITCSFVIFHTQSNTTDETESIVDSSNLDHDIIQSGDAKHTTSTKLFGDSSIKFDGDGDLLYTDSQYLFDGDFTAETWLNVESIPSVSGFNLSNETSSSLLEQEETLEIDQDTVLEYTNDRVSSLTSNTITLTNLTGGDFEVDQRLLLITTYGSLDQTVGNYEFVEISSITGDTLSLKSNIQKQYDTQNYTFIIGPKRYKKIIVNENVNVSAAAWSDSSATIQGLILLSAEEVVVKGNVSANNLGFRGGDIGDHINKNGGIGESYVPGNWNLRQTVGAFGSGGAGIYRSFSGGDIGTSGAGAGHGTAGSNGSENRARGGIAFAAVNNTIKEKIFMGPGGGQGGSDNAAPWDGDISTGGFGGRGGGIIIIDAINCEVTSSGSISANGQNGGTAFDPGNAEPGHGGGGAGGSILFMGNLNNEGQVRTSSGNRGGGDGVIAWFGYQVGNKPQDALDHYLYKNTSFVLAGGSSQSSIDGGTEFGMILVPSKDSSGYQVAYGSAGDNVLAANSLSFNNWYHLAVVRKDNLETFYLNGISISSRQYSTTYQNSAYVIGAQPVNDFEEPLYLKGCIQDLRITKRAIYDTDFTAPSSLLIRCRE